MDKELVVTLKRFAGLFRAKKRLPWTIVLPLVAVLVSWPLLQVWLNDERATFMAAFVLALGLRLIWRTEWSIHMLRSQISRRGTIIVSLLFGPGVIAALIWVGEPIWCQRFLSLYFLVMSGLYLLDLIDARHMMVRHFLPSDRNLAANGLMTRVMAVFYMSLFLLNETLISQTNLTVWLIYFGLLPMLSHRVLLALVRTVDEAYAKGYGRL